AYINEGRTVLALLEPACGVGGIVLAANQVLREQGFDLENEIHWTCIDIDWRALCGAFIQLELTGTPATLVEGNSITMEYAAAWPTSALILQRRNQLHSDGVGVEYSYTQEGRIPAWPEKIARTPSVACVSLPFVSHTSARAGNRGRASGAALSMTS